jgi:serine/threonine protein kinase
MNFPNAHLQTILFLAANPKDTTRLRLDQELRDIDEGLQRAKMRDQFSLERRLAVRPRDIQRAMLDLEPEIVHFSGHGSGTQGLIFEDEIGNAKPVDGEALASLFALFANRVSCVVLNGCYSEVQAQSITKHITYVIGMNQTIGDKAAISFAVGFYDALGAGKDIEFAYKLGCAAIRLEGIPEYLTPTLHRNNTLSSQRGGISQTISEKIQEEKRKLKQIKISGGTEDDIKKVGNKIKRLERKRGQNPELEKGLVLSERYELLEILGIGGFATVWKAYDEGEHSNGVVAIKILHEHYSKDESQRNYFFRGARTMSKLKHPNIVRVIEPEARHEKYFYFVMEFIDGKNLEQAILDNENPPSDIEVIENILRNVSDALEFAHSKGYIHRDIKPQNILLDRNKTAYLTDFNLILMKSDTARMSTGIIGSFIYTSPEALGYHEIGKSSDVYSLGMTTIFCLYRRYLPPEVFRDSSDFIDRELDYVPSIKAILIKAAAFEINQRFDSIEDFYISLSSAWQQRKKQLIEVIPPKKEQGEQKIKPYWIGKFTVTNTEYRKFINDNGYSSKGVQLWWSETGQEVWKVYQDRGEHPHIHRMRRDDESTDYPLAWNDKSFNHPAQPVVGVCWYEAEAYCNWLTSHLREKNPEKWCDKLVALPTEKQWEYAARGENNYLYPWGNLQPTEKLANFNMMKNKPSVVEAYPDGISWCGCHDMSGNILEWCRNSYDNSIESPPNHDKVIKGGCFYDNNIEDRFSISISNRRARKPGYRHSAIGFRIVIESLK